MKFAAFVACAWGIVNRSIETNEYSMQEEASSRAEGMHWRDEMNLLQMIVRTKRRRGMFRIQRKDAGDRAESGEKGKGKREKGKGNWTSRIKEESSWETFGRNHALTYHYHSSSDSANGILLYFNHASPLCSKPLGPVPLVTETN